MKKHDLIVHYKCRYCPYSSGSRKAIRKHVKKEHGVRGRGKGGIPKHSNRGLSDSDITSSYYAFTYKDGKELKLKADRRDNLEICSVCKGTGVGGIPDFEGSTEVVTIHECFTCKGKGVVKKEVKVCK